MGNGKSPPGEDSGDRQQKTDQRLAAIRAVSIGGRATQGKVTPVSFYSYRSGELNRLVSEYEQIHFKPGRKSKDTINKLNKLAESIGEVSADIEVRKKYGSLIKERIKIPVRRNGVPVLDLAYELTTGEIVIVEAKYNNSLRGRVNDVIIAADDVAGSGAGQRIALKGETEQLSGRWVKDRVNEVGKHDRRLGNKLVAAIENDKLIVLEHRAKANIDDKAKKIVIEPVAKNETERVTKFLKEGRQPITDKERAVDRKLAKDEGFLREDFKTAKSKSASLKREADKAQKTLKKTLREFESAEKKLKNLGPRSKPETRIKYTTLVDQKRHELADARKAFEAAEKASVQAAEDLAKVSKNLEAVRATQKARFAEQRATQLARMTEQRLAGAAGAGAAGKAEKIAGEAGKIVKVAEEAMSRQATRFVERRGVRTVVGLGVKGGRVLMTAGKFIFRVVNIANPVLDLLMVVDGIDALVRWLKRDEIAEAEEWARLIQYLSLEDTPTVLLPPYNYPYPPGFGTVVRWNVNRILESGSGRSDSFLDWFDKWNKIDKDKKRNTDEKWSGFVYSTVWVSLEQQRAREDGYPYEYTFWHTWFPEATHVTDVSLSATPPQNTKTTLKSLGALGETDPRNRITRGAPTSYSDLSKVITVDIEFLDVRYTYATPVLTPFDFLIVKCNALIADFANFLCRYMDTMTPEMVDVVDSRARATTGALFGKARFGPAFDDRAVQWCFQALVRAADQLATHSVDSGDNNVSKGMTLNNGYLRRYDVLRTLSNPASKDSFFVIASVLSRMATHDHRSYLIQPIDPKLDYLKPEYLQGLALEIHDDVQWTFKRCSNEATRHEFNYKGLRAPQPRR